MKAKILIVDDDSLIGHMVEDILGIEGYSVAWAKSTFIAESLLAKGLPDLLILDWNLPGKSGLEICRELRLKPDTKVLPILFLTGRKGLEDKVSGMRLGGDDYLTKPFAPGELVVRVEALLRRAGWKTEAVTRVESGGISLDLSGRKAYMKGKEFDLWRKEFDLLQAFLERPGHVLTRQFLLERVWGLGQGVELSTKVVDVTVGNLRRKLKSHGDAITAVKGIGYRYDP